MANITTTNPWVLDTAGVIELDNPVLVKDMRWESPTTDGHQIVVKDKFGSVKWDYTCFVGGTGTTYEGPTMLNMQGFNLSTLSSGKLYVHLR